MSHYLDMTTQLSNLSTIRNLIKAQRTLENVQLVFYRLCGSPYSRTNL